MSRIAEQLQPQPDLFSPRPRLDTLMPDGIPIEVCVLFERLALQVSRNGYERYSSDAILHRIRWELQIEKGDREFKANNNWTAPLARWFLANHPDMPKFFETRQSPEKRDGI